MSFPWLLVPASLAMTARLGCARVPADGDPLDGGELHALLALMRDWPDRAGTRAVAAAERHAEERARETGKQA